MTLEDLWGYCMGEFINDLIENYTWYLSKCNEFKVSKKGNRSKNFIRENNNMSLNYNLINMKDKYKDFHSENYYKNMLDIQELIDGNDFDTVEIKIRVELQELININNMIKM